MVATPPTSGDSQPVDGGGDRELPKGFAAVGVITVVATAFVSLVSLFGVGTFCTDSSGLERGQPRALVCEAQFGSWDDSSLGPASLVAKLHSLLGFTLPTLIVLTGFIVSTKTARRYPFRVARLVGGLLILLPWLGIVLLPAS
jgi:hypothetical protein